MKISEIDLWNFRQFHARQTLRLACGEERNVTLIHAENGVGKTTLLNAVYWAFFGQVTPRFEQRHRLVNFEAEKRGVQETKVEVEFEFDGREFRASRRHVNGDRDAELSIFEIDRGSLRPLDAPKTFINSVIPEPMAKYFFFDGEHAESFAAEQNRGAGAAIRSMLGCDLAERGMEDLKAVATSYTRQVGNMPGDADVERLQIRLGQLEEQQAEDEAALADHRKTIAQAEEQKALIEEALRRIAGAKEIQQLRDELQRQLDTTATEVETAEAEVVRWIGTKAISIVSRKLTKETLDFIDEQELRGRIPSPYNEDFIQGLLSSELCICCRELKPQSEQWAAVVKLLETAGNGEALNRVVRARARLQSLREQAGDAPKLLAMAQNKVSMGLEKRRSLEQRLGEESRKLSSFDLSEVRDREESLKKIEKLIRERTVSTGQVQKTIELRQGQIDSLSAEITAKVAKNEKAKTIFAKRKLALDAASLLRERLTTYEVTARDDIEAEINRILARTARRNYRFSFGDDFAMSLHQDDIDGPVPKSGGENQLMSLAFTAALINFSKARIGQQDVLLSPGTVAPLVLDAPIGHLDVAYRRATAEFIPDMAGQVVLLLSSAHASPDVLEALRPRIGMEYVLVSENRGPQNGKGDDAISLHGQTYIRSLFNQELTRTRIEQVLS